MENAVEALKIAGAVLMFVLALTLSISSLSQANQSVSEIVNNYDKEAQYEYIKPSSSLTRVVGADAVVTTMYKAYEENIEIYFKKADGSKLPIYYKTDSYGEIERDENNNPIEVDYINLAKEGFSDFTSAETHLSMILAGKNRWKNQHDKDSDEYKMLDSKKYGKQFGGENGTLVLYQEGFYEYLSKHTFIENLGEYYQGNDSTKIKKRVITYQVKE